MVRPIGVLLLGRPTRTATKSTVANGSTGLCALPQSGTEAGNGMRLYSLHMILQLRPCSLSRVSRLCKRISKNTSASVQDLVFESQLYRLTSLC